MTSLNFPQVVINRLLPTATNKNSFGIRHPYRKVVPRGMRQIYGQPRLLVHLVLVQALRLKLPVCIPCFGLIFGHPVQGKSSF